MLYATAARHFGKREAEAALYSRRLGEARPRLGYPQGKPGPGGGIFLSETRQAALYLLGMAASATAGDAPAAVRTYASLVSHGEHPLGGLRSDLSAQLPYLNAMGFEEAAEPIQGRLAQLAPLPRVFDFLRSTEHKLVDALTWLLEDARVEEKRERLRRTLGITIWRTLPLAMIEVDDALAGERFRVTYAPDTASYAPPERDGQIAATFTDRLIRDVGAVLGANSHSGQRDTLPDEADGALSDAGHPRAKAASPAPHAEQSSAAATRFPPPGAPGSLSSPDGLATGDSHGPSQPVRLNPPAARHRRERRREST